MLNRPRVVFDCVIFLQAAISGRGPASAALTAAEQGRIELLVSPTIMAEMEDVLKRPNIQSRFPQLTATRIAAFLEKIFEFSTVVQEVPAIFEYPRDSDDEPYLNLAIDSHADFLVTRDRDLLDLVNEQNVDGERLHVHAPRLQIVDPATFLKMIEPREESAGSLN